MSDISIKKDIVNTYLAVINNSIGSGTFKNFYVEEDNFEFDATENGTLSCAFFVSSILAMFNLIKNIHGTVEKTVQDMESSGYKKI